MDRKLYLELCQKVSMLKCGICGIKENVPDELKVLYEGIVYYPIAYELSFLNGKPIHRVIIHDLHANCVVHAYLERVERFEQARSV